MWPGYKKGGRKNLLVLSKHGWSFLGQQLDGGRESSTTAKGQVQGLGSWQSSNVGGNQFHLMVLCLIASVASLTWT